MATKIFSIRIKNDSTLPERLKKLAEKARVQNSELLEMWVEMAERGEIPATPYVNASDQTEEIESLKSRIAALEQMQKKLADDVVRAEFSSIPAESILEMFGDFPDDPNDVEFDEEDEETKIANMKYIIELATEKGIKIRRITPLN